MEFKEKEQVIYLDTTNKLNKYYIERIETGNKIEGGKYVFGRDKTGFPILYTFSGKYELILSEHDQNDTFIINVACEFNNIEKIV